MGAYLQDGGHDVILLKSFILNQIRLKLNLIVL